MSRFDEPSACDDDELSNTLRRFFDAEMPSDIRALIPADVSVNAGAIAAPLPSRRWSRRLGLGVVAATLLVACAFWMFTAQSENRQPAIAEQPPEAVPSESEIRNPKSEIAPQPAPFADDGRGDPSGNVAVFEVIEPLNHEMYVIPDGLVDQRTSVTWTNVSLIEPSTGASIDWSLPEVAIDIDITPIAAE